MTTSLPTLTRHLLARLRQVQQNLGMACRGEGAPDARFADELDSMGLVEFVALVAEDHGATPAEIERCAGRSFSTVAALAEALHTAGLRLAGSARERSVAPSAGASLPAQAWLGPGVLRLPTQVESAADLDRALAKPAGWFERHAGICQRHFWGEEDPLAAAAAAASECLERAGLHREDVGAVLVTAEAPPRLVGLAAALHHRLGLAPQTPAFEVGGACCGFLTALWLAQRLLPQAGAVLLVAVEAPTRFLYLQPGAAGEAAALFGDAAAAALVGANPLGRDSVPLGPVLVGCDGGAADLIDLQRSRQGLLELHLEGRALAGQAVQVMSDLVRGLVELHGLALGQLAGVVAHGGNGRMLALLARQLGLPRARIWSTTPTTGNLGSASLLAAWATRPADAQGPVAWAAVGAGLTWAATGTAMGNRLTVD